MYGATIALRHYASSFMSYSDGGIACLCKSAFQATSLHKDCRSVDETYDVDQPVLFLCKLWLLDFGPFQVG